MLGGEGFSATLTLDVYPTALLLVVLVLGGFLWYRGSWRFAACSVAMLSPLVAAIVLVPAPGNLLAVVALYPVLMIGLVAFGLQQDQRLRLVVAEEWPEFAPEAQQLASDLVSLGFVPARCYTIKNSALPRFHLVFVSEHIATFASFSVSPAGRWQKVLELRSTVDGGDLVTTSSGFLEAAPVNLRQVFPDTAPSELIRHHVAAQDFVQSRGLAIHPVSTEPTRIDLAVRANHADETHWIQQQNLLRFAATTWWRARRSRRANLGAISTRPDTFDRLDEFRTRAMQDRPPDTPNAP